MQLDVGQVRRPDQGGQILHQAIMHIALISFAPNLRRFHPGGPVSRAVLLVKKFTVYAIWIALHGQRPVLQVRKQYRRDTNVIIDHLPFGEASFWIKNLVEIRDRKLFSINQQLGFVGHDNLRFAPSKRGALLT